MAAPEHPPIPGSAGATRHPPSSQSTPATQSDPDQNPADSGTWSGRRVAVGVTGGISCFKTASLVSNLVQEGAQVRMLMTEAATRFITPLTFQSLSGSPVVTSVWEAHDLHESHHVGLARWCELMIIAPATADTLARLACGLTGDVVCLTAHALPRETPVIIAPAMNAQMWQNPITQRNVTTVCDVLGYHLVGPEEGWQACRTKGPGRMSEPVDIMAAAEDLLGGH